MSSMAPQFTGVSSVCSTVCSSADQRKHQSSASLAFVRGTTGHLCIPLTKGNVAISWRHNDDASRLANGDTRLQAVVTLADIKAGNSVMWYHLWNAGPWAEEINKFLLATLLLVKL